MSTRRPHPSSGNVRRCLRLGHAGCRFAAWPPV
uniref:Uncharacterized protein n=1 Tax=Romanomermis culicivorax TaxID=13658 RepID=A0A915HVL5_ROMCU